MRDGTRERKEPGVACTTRTRGRRGCAFTDGQNERDISPADSTRSKWATDLIPRVLRSPVMPVTRFSPPRGWFDKASVSGSILSDVSSICEQQHCASAFPTALPSSHGAVSGWTRLESDDDASLRKRVSEREDANLLYEDGEVVFGFELEPKVALWAAYAYELRRTVSRSAPSCASGERTRASGSLGAGRGHSGRRVSIQACRLTIALCPAVVAVSEWAARAG